MDRIAKSSLRRVAALLIGTGIASLAAAQPALPISPRLFAEQTKDVRGTAAVLIPADGRTLPDLPDAQRLADGRVLARVTPARLEEIAATGSLGWAMPQQPVLIPDDVQDDVAGPDAPDAPIAKSTVPVLVDRDGSGITIGLIDFGSISPTNPAQGQLRKIWRQGPTAATSHADKVLKLAHAQAPGATFLVALLPTNPGEKDVIDAAHWLRDQGARIINFSGASYGGRRDGSSPLDELADDLAARGILFIASAGNEARRSWAGPLADRDNDGLVDTAEGDLMLDASGGEVLIQLTWDDWQSFWNPLARRRHDLDLQLLATDGRLIRAATTDRSRGGEPMESLGPLRLAPGLYRLRLPIRSRGNGEPLVQIVATGAVNRLLPAVAQYSIAIPGTGRGTFTVGARAAARGALPASYSGRGPTLDNRPKPDVLSLGIGPGSASGTSYAAPRIAGLAARIWSANPQMPLAALRAMVQRAAPAVID